jgi:hypothetical protein
MKRSKEYERIQKNMKDKQRKVPKEYEMIK